MAITRNAGATYFIPSENEWYKAAYYDPTLNGGARLLGLSDEEQHRAHQHAFDRRARTTPTFTMYTREWRLHRSDEWPDAGRRFCRLTRAVWHV